MELERWLHKDVIQLDHYDHYSVLRSEHLKAARPHLARRGDPRVTLFADSPRTTTARRQLQIAARTARSRTPTDVACAAHSHACARLSASLGALTLAESHALLGTRPRVRTGRCSNASESARC